MKYSRKGKVSTRKNSSRKRTARKNSTRKNSTRKRTARKNSTRKNSTRKNSTRKRTTRKNSTRKNSNRKRTTRKTSARKNSTRKSKGKQSNYLTSWRDVAPRKQSDRVALKNSCGSKCFLRPQDLKFPICNKKCEPQCNGLLSAYIRAKQWKYEKEALSARRIGRQHDCGWALRQKD